MTGAGALARSGRRAAAALLVAVAGLLALSPQAEAVTLVNNLSESTTSTPTVGGSSNFRQAQKFTVPTGQDYSLDDVTIGVGFRGADGIVVSIRDGSAADPPGTALYTLIDPASPGTGNQTYSAPAGAVLEGGNNYFVMLERAQNSGGSSTVRGTDDDGQSGETGWLIDDVRRKRSGSTWSDDTHALKIRIRGDVYTPSTDATLSDLELEGATGGEVILLIPGFDSATETYTASVANRIDAVTLTATKNDTTATVAITSDDDTSTEGEADLDLNVGSNTLTVTVTPESGAAKTYTITVTRAAVPPAPTDCPADTDWCTTLGVGYATDSTASFKIEDWGYRSDRSYGDLLSTTFSHGGTGYTVSQVSRTKITQLPGNTVTSDSVNIKISPALPDGTVLQLGSRTFTVDTDSATNTIGQEQWGILGNPLSWTAGQHVTASLKFPTAPDQPTGLTATANGATQIDLAWVAPADNGGATISGYRIEVSADAGTTWTNLLANTGTTNVTYSHTGLTRGSTRHYRVSAINANGTGAASDATSATTATPTPPAPPEITVPNDWSLIPTGHSTGDKFRLIFLSSTKTNAGSADIVDYNTFIQGRAAGGHSDIQTYSAGFRAVGCTDDSDATANTATTGTGVVIYWLNGNKVADDYTDFYDGSWDEERNNQDRNELGNNGPDTSNINNYPYTGCKHDGTESITGTTSYALGAPGGFVRTGRPNSTASGDGPISSGDTAGNTFTRPMYGLSQVFEVADAVNTAATGTPSIDGTPQVGMVLTAAKGTLADVDGTTKADNGDTGYAYSYQWVRVDGSTETPITGATARTYTLTAADLGKTIKVQTSFTDDGDTAEGPFTSAATVAVLAAAGACPTDNDWCTTLTVEHRQQSPSVHYYGYIEVFDTGALDDTTINYEGRIWTINALIITDDAGTRTVTIDLPTLSDGFLSRGSVFTLGGQEFTATAAAEDVGTGIYNWPAPAGMAWIDGQAVTVSVELANFAATGEPTISGTAQVGETLTAAIGNIADTDGLPATFPGDYTFEWLRVDGGTDSPITGATASTYTPVAADVGKTVKVTVSFTDDGGTGEDRTSNETVAVLAAAGACPTDNDWCTTLTVEFRQQSPSVQYYGYADSISLGALDDSAINYGGRRWRIYALYITDDAGTRTIKVDFPIADGFLPRGSVFNLGGQDFTATAAAEDATQGIYTWPVPAAMAWIDGQAVTVSVELANFAATGEPAISGTAQVGETLTAAIGNIADTDGLPATFPDDYTFQWLRRDGGTDSTITGATAITYTPVAADVGKKVKVTVSFTDDGGTGEDRTSIAFPSSGTITAGTLPALSFVSNEVTVDEDAGTATLTIELDPASTGTVTVDFATRDRLGDAIAGEDYTTTSGTLTFAATETSKTITVPITDDDVYENALEVFYVDLSNPTGATLPDPPSAGIGINSEDAVPTASMADVTVDEGAGTMTLTLRLNHPSHEDIAYVTRVVDVTGTATEGDDYDDFLLGPAGTARITVPGGDLSQTFDITLVDDGVDEADETIIILWQKSTSDEVTPVAINFTGTITDNDTAGVTLSKTLLTVTEEDTTGDSYSVVLNSQPTADVVVTVAGHSGTDVTPTPTTLTFTPINWETVQPVTVTAGTDMDMVNETVSLTHSAASTDANYNGITIGGVAVSVHDDDTGNNLATGKPAISGTAQEGETLTAAIGNIADTDGLPATFPDDYAFQWLRVDADGMSNETDIGADAVTYTPVAADVGKKVKVKVHFTDADSNPETLASNAYPSSGTITAGTLPVLSISGITVDEDAGSATLTVELTPASTGTVTVDYATRDQVGGATAGDDYTATSGTLTFTAGQTSKTITVPITDDDIYENYEAFFVDLSNPTGATLPVFPTAAVGIDSEDAVPTASMADVTVDEGAGTMTLILRLSHLSHEDIAYSTVDTRVTGTATEGEDYDDFLLGPPAGTARITVPGGSLSQTFDITVVDDGVDEPDETIVILWQKVTGDDVTPTTFTFTGTIVPEPLPALSFALSVVTVDEDAGSATHTVELTPASTGTVTVDFATRDHGAKAGEDYTATSGTLTFTAGQTSKTITVPITDDDAYEAPGLTGEIFFIDLSNPTGATLPDPPLTGVIIDSEEAVPTASMADVTVDEGAGTMTLTLRLSHPSQKDITYFTREDDVTGTATEGEDYDDFLLETGRIAESTVPGGSLSQTFGITLVDDGVDEPDETIIIVWQKSTSDMVTPEFFTFTGTIVPEPLPALSFDSNEVTVDEDAGSATLTVELDPASTGTVTVDFATRDGVGGAKAGEDYTATSGTLTFTAGQTSKTITVPITDDDVYENNESFDVDLSTPTGATLPDPPSAIVRIDSEEAVPTASMADVTVDEGAGTMTLTLRLSHPSGAETGYFTIYDEDVETGTATAGEDYDDFLLGPPGRTARITVPAFNLSQTFDITLVDDSEDEPDETIFIAWTVFPNHDVTPGAFNFTGTITDNDTAANNPPVFDDGDNTNRAFSETLGNAAVTMASDIGTPIVAMDDDNDMLTYRLEGADAAKFGIIPTNGQLRTKAGEKYDYEAKSSYAVTVKVVDDNGGADTIDVTVNVTNNSGEMPLAPAVPTVTTTPGSMTGLDVFWVAPDNSGRPPITGYDLRYRAGTAVGWTADPQDISGTSASITGLAEDTSYQVQVRATNDDGDGDWSPSGSARTGAPPTPTVRFGATSYTAIEGVGGATVTVALSVPAARSVTVRLTKTHLGGATAADYDGVPSSVTFAAGETEKTFIVTAVVDTADDDGESVQLGFDTLPAGVAPGSPATATVALVQDADVSTWYVWFGASAYTATEGGTARITVHLNSPWKPERNEALTVPLFDPQHRGGASADDYSGVPESVTFQPGQTRASFTVRVTDDSDDDDGESVLLGFRSLFPDDLEVGRYGPGSTTLRIDDNDGETAVTVSFEAANYTAVEGGATATVGLRLSTAPGREVTIPLTTENRGATSGDYTVEPSSVTFEPSETEKTLTVTATDDSVDDDLESVAIGFGSLPARVSAGSPSEAVVNLTDNDGGEEMLTVRFGVRAGVQLDGVEEGGGYRLSFRLDRKPGRKLTIPLTYEYRGGATAADFEDLPAAVTFGKNATSAGVTVRPVDDFEEDPGESLRVAFGTLPVGVQVSSWSGPSVIIPVIDDDAPPGLSVADASAREWPNKKVCLVFEVTMDLMDVDHDVSVDYATRSGTAVAGQDFKPISGTLVFRPADSRRRTASKSLCVEVIDDSHDEGLEEMTLVLSNPVRAYLADATATGYISNTDPMPQAWLGRFGRTVATHALEAVGERLSEGAGAASHVTLGGWRIALNKDLDKASSDETEPASETGPESMTDAAGMPGPDNETDPTLREGLAAAARQAGVEQPGHIDGRRPAGSMVESGWETPGNHSLPGVRALLLRSSFRWTSAQEALTERAVPGVWTTWGRARQTSFNGNDSDVSVGGEVTTYTLGADYERGRLLAGVALARSEGDGDFKALTGAGAGELDSSMTSVHPYVRYALSERLEGWGMLGYGRGGMQLSDTVKGETVEMETDIDLRMGALGLRGAVWTTQGLQVALRSDAFWVQTGSAAADNLVATRADVSRVRLVLEGKGALGLPWGANLAPSVELGLRYDEGDAETGIGVELGGGLQYAGGRLNARVTARTLLAHEDGGYREWGIGGSLGLSARAGGRGLALSLSSQYGMVSSGVNALWARQTAAGLANRADMDPVSQYGAELSYGLVLPWRWGLLTPYSKLDWSGDRRRALQLGARLTQVSGWHWEMAGQMQEQHGLPAARGVLDYQWSLNATRRW